MEFFKKLKKSLFGSSRSSTPKKNKKFKIKAKKKSAKKVSTKKRSIKSKKKIVRKIRSAKKKTRSSKKQPKIIKKALEALPAAEVTHYFPHVNAAVVKVLQGVIRVGDELEFKGHTTLFRQKVASMQMDHQPIPLANKGEEIGIQVKTRVRAGDKVYIK